MSAISAASRSPMFRPCAPIGGSTWAASPTSAMRALANCRGCSMPSGNRCRPGSTATRPRMECDCCLRGFRQFVIAQRDQPFGFPGGGDPHHAAAVAGQGHEHARTLRGVKLRGDISMRPRMADVEGQRRLVEAAAADLDAGGLAGTAIAVRRRRPRGAPPATWPSRVWIATSASSGLIVTASSSNRVRPESLGGALLQRLDQRRGSRCCSRTPRDRFRRKRTGPPAPGSAGRCRRPAASRAAPPPGPCSAARPPAVRADRPSRPAAPWCGCRHRARGGRPAPCARRSPPARPRPRVPAGPPPITTTS